MNVVLIKGGLSAMQIDKLFGSGVWAADPLTLQVAMSCLPLLE